MRKRLRKTTWSKTNRMEGRCRRGEGIQGNLWKRVRNVRRLKRLSGWGNRMANKWLNRKKLKICIMEAKASPVVSAE